MSTDHPAVLLLFLSGMAIHWLIPFAAWFMLRGHNDQHSRIWFSSAALYAVAVTLFVLGPLLPDWLVRPLGSAVTFLALLGFAQALRSEWRAPDWQPVWAMVLVLFGVQLWLTQTGHFESHGRALNLLLVTVVDAGVTRLAWRLARWRQSRALWIVMWVFGIGSVTAAVRLLDHALGGQSGNLLSFSPTASLGLLINYLAGIFYCFGYWGFVLEKSQHRLVLSTEAQVAAREREKQALERQEMTERIASITQLAQSSAVSAAIAHEINQPLAALRLDADFALALAQDLPPQHAIHRPLTRIGRDAMRTAAIVERMRQLFRPSVTPAQLQDPNKVIGTVAGLLLPALRKAGVDLRLDLQAHASVRISEGELEQVVQNLMRNALEALALEPTASPWIELVSWHSPQGWCLSCTDNGPGVPETLQEQVFNMQFSTKQQNLGLGLWLSRHLVERCGGKLWLDKMHPGGARFVMQLPILS